MLRSMILNALLLLTGTSFVMFALGAHDDATRNRNFTSTPTAAPTQTVAPTSRPATPAPTSRPATPAPTRDGHSTFDVSTYCGSARLVSDGIIVQPNMSDPLSMTLVLWCDQGPGYLTNLVIANIAKGSVNSVQDTRPKGLQVAALGVAHNRYAVFASSTGLSYVDVTERSPTASPLPNGLSCSGSVSAASITASIAVFSCSGGSMYIADLSNPDPQKWGMTQISPSTDWNQIVAFGSHVGVVGNSRVTVYDASGNSIHHKSTTSGNTIVAAAGAGPLLGWSVSDEDAWYFDAVAQYSNLVSSGCGETPFAVWGSQSAGVLVWESATYLTVATNASSSQCVGKTSTPSNVSAVSMGALAPDAAVLSLVGQDNVCSDLSVVSAAGVTNTPGYVTRPNSCSGVAAATGVVCVAEVPSAAEYMIHCDWQF